jgi:hypothetical protein
MESYGHPGTDYDHQACVVTICYETPFAVHFLVEAAPH